MQHGLVWNEDQLRLRSQQIHESQNSNTSGLLSNILDNMRRENMPENLLSRYKKLLEKNKTRIIFNTAQGIVRWDMQTKMPPRGIGLRSQQIALLSRLEHKMSTDPEVGALLQAITRHKDYEKLNAVQIRNVYLVKKNYDEQTKIPEELVAQVAKQRAITVDVWKKAKAAKNFSKFRKR